MPDTKPIRARSADGVIHSFPAGTPIPVINMVMKKYAQQHSGRLNPQEQQFLASTPYAQRQRGPTPGAQMSATPKPTVYQRLVGVGESLLKTNPMVMMTPDFMMPKQLRGSALTDIYNRLPAPLRNDTAESDPEWKKRIGEISRNVGQLYKGMSSEASLLSVGMLGDLVPEKGLPGPKEAWKLLANKLAGVEPAIKEAQVARITQIAEQSEQFETDLAAAREAQANVRAQNISSYRDMEQRLRETNYALSAQYSKTLQEYQEAVNKAAGENASAADRVTRFNAEQKMQAMQREAAGREIQNMQPKLQQHLQAVRDSAKGALDARWDAIRKTVGSNITADVTNIANTNANAAKLVSKTNIEDFQKIIGNAFGNANWGTLTWRDMQAAYTDLGQTLARGDLPGDLYQGLKLYQQGIGQEMENMVTRAGGSPTVLRSLKADWSAFMRDFVDTSRPMAHGGSPIAHALRNVDAPNLAKVLQRPGGQRAIALLENYKMYGANPELLQQYRELVESYADMPKGGRVMNLPSPKVVAAPKPPLFERPPNVAPYKPPPPTPTRPLEPPEVDIEGVRKQMLSQLKRKAISRGAPIVGGTMLGWLLRNWLSQTAK